MHTHPILHRIIASHVAPLLGLLLVACQGEGTPLTAQGAQGRPIIGGTTDTSAAHMAVVALVPPQNSGYIGMHCSGTLITPTVVLTAAHCLEGYSVGDFDIFFGNNVWQSGTYRAVSEQQQHPSYTGTQNPVADLGLVRLASPAPSSVTPIPVLPTSLFLTQSDEGGAVVFSGFGVTQPGGSSEGIKMTVASTIGKVCLGPSGCNWNGAWVVQSAIGYGENPGGPCSGDSGGPAFVTRSGQEYLAAVTSYGDENCTQYGVSIMPQGYASWVQSFTGGTTSEICSNSLDDDQDGLTDCADPDCANAANCQVADACAAASTLTCGGQVSGTTVGGSTTFTTNGCLQSPEQGPERAYEVSATAGTQVTATLTMGGAGDLDLFLFPAASGGCNTSSCLASSMNEGTASESFTFTMPAGGAYLVVETWNTASAFTLQLTCPTTQLENCSNNVDDDGDGAIDCADSDCANTSSCQTGAENCANGVDDDGDGAIDCADPDCAGTTACQSAMENCSNSVDDDGDGLVDCADPNCQATSACQAGAENCTNGVDDDGDGLVDCADPNCQGTSACPVVTENCTNGIDDDGDSATDCGDPDCASAPNCKPDTELTPGGCSCDQGARGGSFPLILWLLVVGIWLGRRWRLP